MGLESFFTPIELESGIVSTSKVEQLVSLLQQGKVPSHEADMHRNWSTVAKILSVTQSSDCLRLFIQLGGVKSLDRCLQEAQKGEVCSSEKLVDELIIAVLDALKKLPFDEEGLRACGIEKTIESFLSYKNFEIEGRAKDLFACWGKIKDMDAHLKEESCNAQTVQDSANNIVPVDLSFDNVQNSEEKCTTGGILLTSESGGYATDCPSNVSVDTRGPGASDALLLERSVPSDMPQKDSSKGIISKVVSSENVIGLGDERISENEGNKLIHENCSGIDMSKFKDNPLSLPVETSKKNHVEPSLSMSKTVVSSLCPTNINQPSFLAEQCDADEEGKEKISPLSIDYSNLEQKYNESRTAKLTEDSPDYWKKIMQQKPEKHSNVFLSSKVMMDNADALCGKDGFSMSNEEVFTFRVDVKKDSIVKSDMKMKAVERLSIMEDKNDSSILTLERENMTERAGENLEMDLAYGVVDALEVARQVAKEVEEEVGIYREASCSSSSKIDMDGEAINPSTADSADVQKRSEVGRNESCNEHTSLERSHSFKEVDQEMTAENEESCSVGEEAPQEASVTMPENEDRIHDQEFSQITTVPQESSINEKAHLGFDLNEDIQMEEGDCPEQSPGTTVSPFHVKALSAPIPMVATSKGPAGASISRLQFEGELGWRGTAATSAFRPASSRRTPDKDNTCSIDENHMWKHSNLSSRIDLNVADGGDAAPMDMFADKHGRVDKHGQMSLSLPSDDSSMEVSSKRAERLNLDLNYAGEIDENCQDRLSDHPASFTLQHQQNASLSTSAASLGSLKRDFDLNDNPSFSDAYDSQGTDFSKPSKMARLDASAVSIMGSTIQQGTNRLPAPNRSDSGSLHQEYAIEQKELLNHMQPFLVGSVPYIGQMGRVVPVQPSLAFATQPAFPSSGMGLGLSVLPSSSSRSMGAVPYVLDSRGATVMSQMLGPGALAAFPRPFLMGVVASSQGTDASVSRPNLDLNAAGSTSLEADSRDGGGIRNLFLPGGGSGVEDHLKAFQQISVAGTPMKHKEPDCGWEPYQIGYKRTSWN